MSIRKEQKIIDDIKGKVIKNIKNLGIDVKKDEQLGRTVYSLDNGKIFIDIIYASLNKRGEYFFGIEQEQFEKIYKKNRNFFQIFICENEKQVFIIPLSFMIEILRDARATNHLTFHQWKPVFKLRNGVWVLRLFGYYNVTEYFNRYDYLISDEEKTILPFITPKYTSEIEIEGIDKRFKTLAVETNIPGKDLHSTTIEMLRKIGEWNGYLVLTEQKPIGNPKFPYKIDCLWYKDKDLYLAIEVCDKGSIEKDKDALKLAKQLGARKVIIVTEINKLKRVRDIFMYNGEIRSWTEVWSFNRIFNMYDYGQKFFKDFIKFNNYSWNENIVEYI